MSIEHLLCDNHFPTYPGTMKSNKVQSFLIGINILEEESEVKMKIHNWFLHCNV